jgi:hypothetical protein
MSIGQVVEHVKPWTGPVLGFAGGVVKDAVERGFKFELALETFFYGACGAAGVLFVQEVYKIIKEKLKQKSNKDGKVD